MRADEMTFGIEIECFIPADVAARENISVGGYGSRSGRQVPGLPEGWKATYDSSISTNRPNYIAVEIVSPVLRGREGIESVIAAVSKLNEWGAKTNRSTGFHVHVGANLRGNARVVRNLICLGAKFERGLFALTGTKSREHARWAAPMSQMMERFQNLQRTEELAHVTRYQSINFDNLHGGHGHGTVEFRVFQGTTNITKILGYIQVCLGLVENAYAMRRRPTYRCSNYRHQTGRGIVYRMLRNLNWFSEKRMGDRVFGLLTPDYLEAIKAELTRLATKYDQDATVQQHAALQPVVPPRR